MKKPIKTGRNPSLERDSRYHRRFALLAAQQAEKVLPLFERERPRDGRPRRAIEAIQAWTQCKRPLGMAEVRKLSLDAHAAARAAKSDAARFAARAAGHAVATWHVPTHAMAVPIYACKAILASRAAPAAAHAIQTAQPGSVPTIPPRRTCRPGGSPRSRSPS